MNETEKINENDPIQQIIYNKYDTAILNKVSGTKDVQEYKEGKTQTTWAKFTYVGRETKFITKLFKTLISKSL